jgi:hypothetical protein
MRLGHPEDLMPVWIAQQWSVREVDKAACLEALTDLAEHIKAEHPEVLGFRTQLQWAGDQAHRGFLWAEAYESLTAIEGGTHTPRCDEVWAPIHRLTLAGTHKRGVWLDAGPSWSA